MRVRRRSVRHGMGITELSLARIHRTQRLVLVTGRAGPTGVSFDGHITVDVRSESPAGPPIPAQTWPVTDSYFKALVPLEPGRNTLNFQFHAPTSLGRASSNDTGISLAVSYIPLSQNPPLHLVILAAADSPLTVDCPPERREEHANLQAVIAKFQLWAYMCQAFTAEQMRRGGLGRRTFALDEKDGEPDSLEQYPPRNKRRAPPVHFIRSTHSLREFRDPNNAQQVSPALLQSDADMQLM